MGLDVGQETVSGWTMKSNFDTAVDKVGWGVIGDGARLGAGWARDARARSRVRVMHSNARVPPRREGQKKPQVFGGLVRQNAHLPALDGHTLAHHGGRLGRL
jgi:hypothetical protein